MTERTAFPAGHTVHMSLRHHSERHTDSVAECDCGWLNLVEWPGHDAEQDAEIEAHWQSVEGLPGAHFVDGRGEPISDDLFAKSRTSDF